MIVALQLLVSAGTLTSMWAAGNRRWWGWHLAAVNQLLWVPIIIVGGLWGLAPMAVALTVVFTRNALRAERPARAAVPPPAGWSETFPGAFEPPLPRESMPPIPPALLAEPRPGGWCSAGDWCPHHRGVDKETAVGLAAGPDPDE